MVKKIGLSFLSLLLIFGGLELVARAVPITGDIKTKLESLYLPPFPPKKADYLRVFVYGGSSVQGLPLEKVGWVAQFDDQIRHVLGSKRDVEVYNLGWSGYNSTMVRHSLVNSIVYQPDLLVVYTGENEFIYPQLDVYEGLRWLTGLKNKSGLIKLVLSRQQSPPPEYEPLNFKRPPYRMQWPYYQVKMGLFRRNLEQIIKLSRRHKIPLVLVTPTANVKDWPPVDAKVTTLDYPLPQNQDAGWLYQQGRFIEAKDWDLIPWRASTDQNSFIRSLEDKTTVWVADAEKAYWLNSPDYLPGFNFTIDNVHPTKEGAYLIAKTIIELLQQQKMVKPDWWIDTRPLASLEEYLRRVNFSRQDEFDIYFKTARYAAKNPFFNFAAAKHYLDLAEKIDRQDWRIFALRTIIAWLERGAQAEIPYIQEFTEAVK
jgi:lysophospholipase L1-like esterase